MPAACPEVVATINRMKKAVSRFIIRINRILYLIKDDYSQIYTKLGTTNVGGHTLDEWAKTEELFDVIKLTSNLLGRPVRVLEIGFNIGGASLAFLLAGATVVSCDILPCTDAVKVISSEFPDRFQFYRVQDNVGEIIEGSFDLAFIDGDHQERSFIKDLNICLAHKIPYLLIDDTTHAGHPYINTIVQDRIQTGEFTLIKEYTNDVGKMLVSVNYLV